ncbi:hypothetical protein F5Y01DRAFT_324513 [Xylaria sp. FL0043]|nr:hypothetical protein F5Y01DRAFT_324513 [Xylaria sp. FL0043]
MDYQESYPDIHDEGFVMSDAWWSSAPVLLDDPISGMPSDEGLPAGTGLCALGPSPPAPFPAWGMPSSCYEAPLNFSDAEIDFALNWVDFEASPCPNDIALESHPLISNEESLLPSAAQNSPENLTTKIRRVTINQHQRGILANWVARNPEPYPSKEDKVDLAAATGLSIDQISGWFTRTRQRQLQRIQSNAPALTRSGIPNSLVTNAQHPVGQVPETSEDILGSELLTSSARNTYPLFGFHQPRCTSLPPLSNELLTTSSPRRSRSLPQIFTLEVINYCASALSSVSQARLSLDVAAPTHESDVFPGRKLDDTTHALTRRRVQDSIYPLKPISKPSFVEAWIEDVANHNAFSPAEPLEVTNGSSQTEENNGIVAHSQNNNQAHQEGFELNHFQDSAIAEKTASNVPLQRPDSTASDGGIYTCTYRGCTLRFETPVLLQKHKREGHRQGNTLNHLQDPGLTGQVANSVIFSHPRCVRINPSTGKPCNMVFSRFYDLTRHEDMIHNLLRRRVRCRFCTEEKLFSRPDALTRHIRVCHPECQPDVVMENDCHSCQKKMIRCGGSIDILDRRCENCVRLNEDCSLSTLATAAILSRKMTDDELYSPNFTITSASPQQQNLGKRKRGPRRRAKDCLTCRKRKMKCDESRPQCTNCVRGGFICAGYPAQGESSHIENEPITVWEPSPSPWNNMPLAAKAIALEQDPVARRYSQHENRLDSMSNAGSSAGSVGSAASYMSFGPLFPPFARPQT